MARVKTIDWYERELNTNNSLSNSQIEEYEAEIERLADIEARSYIRSQKRIAEEFARKEEIKAQLLAGNKNYAIAQGMSEFGDDYEIRIEKQDHVVYSKVAGDHQENRRVHKTASEAQSDLEYLIYNRMYDKYVRTGEYDSLGQIE